MHGDKYIADWQEAMKHGELYIHTYIHKYMNYTYIHSNIHAWGQVHSRLARSYEGW